MIPAVLILMVLALVVIGMVIYAILWDSFWN